MRNLDIATLRSLQAVAEYGSVTRAADALNMSQSALSMQMRRLEEQFGRPMLEKAGRGVTLSAFSVDLLAESRRLVSLNDAILARFTRAKPKGRLRVGLTRDWLYTKVALAARAFREDHPDTDLIINDALTRDLRTQIKNGDHDIILTTEFDAPPGAINLAKAELAWFGAIGGNAWQQRPLPIANSPHCAYYPVAMQALKDSGIDWTQLCTDIGNDTWRINAVADLGITILLREISQPGMERIDHGGSLPLLPQTWLNAYVADGPARQDATDFMTYLRRAVSDVAIAA